MKEHYILRAALHAAFGAEWDALSADEQSAVAADATYLAETEPGVSYSEYRDRIGQGHLKAYAKVLLVKRTR